MAEILSVLDRHLDFDPNRDFEQFIRSAPARWAVYLFTDANDRPVQLLCVKNLRYSLKRRLGGGETFGLSKRVNYRDLVRRVRWRRVDSAFEADCIYYEAARVAFPETYRGMTGFRPAWFIHVNPNTTFPRYIKTTDLRRSGLLAGPLEDKHAAARLIELMEDAFDLCRFYQILIEAPSGKACAYKGMGKCPAPCDGSISMDGYRRMIEWSTRTLVDPAPEVRDQTRRMEAAAGGLHFETAAKIKAFVEQLSRLGHGPFRHVRRIESFQFLAVQGAPRADAAKLFLISQGHIQEIVGMIGEDPVRPAQILSHVLNVAAEKAAGPVSVEGAERIGIVTHHLFSPKGKSGSFLPLDSIDEKAIARAYRELRRQPAPDEAVEEEGVLKELQTMVEEH